MRTLTLKREKSFVGCLAKANVYIEDAEANELSIGGVPCRKIGTLKSGETKSFKISEAEAKLFVIADSLSKDFCNDFYQIPTGTDDVSLSGRNRFNPAAGNAFRFNGNDNVQALENRKKGKRLGLVIFSVFIVLGAVGGFFAARAMIPHAKTFTSGGMQITLTDDFRSVNTEKLAAMFYSDEIAVYVEKESFEGREDLKNESCEQYAEFLTFVGNVITDGVKTEDGLTFFFFERVYADTKEIYPNMAYIFKTDDAFWLVRFSVAGDHFDAYADRITKWAKSVSFPS